MLNEAFDLVGIHSKDFNLVSVRHFMMLKTKLESNENQIGTENHLFFHK